MLAIALLVACGPRDPDPEDRSRGRPLPGPLLILAVDALEPDVVLPLLQGGELPVLASLIRGGTWGILRTRQEARSPRIWTTMATGKTPAVHGITGFTYEGEAGERRVFTSEDRRTKAFWNILGEHGIESATIGWWVTFPAEPVLGLMVSQTNTLEDREAGLFKGTLHRDVPGQVYPPQRTDEILAAVQRSEAELDARLERIFGTGLGALDGEPGERWKACRWAFRADTTYLRVAHALAADGPPPVTAVYIGGTDIVGHRFWAAHRPADFGLDPGSEEVRRFGDVVRDYYRFVDAELGRLIEAWPAESTVWIVSDHGMTSVSSMAPGGEEPLDPGVSGEHSSGEPGLFIARGPGIACADPKVDPASLQRSDLPRLGDVLDLCPTLLAFLGVPVGEDMPGRPMASLFDREVFADWPLEYVPTHDDEAWLEGRGGSGLQPRGLEQRLDQLEKLGYIDGQE